MKTYSAFHLHSVYSLLDGFAQLKSYFARADELKLPSISISDHGNIHHVIDAYEISKDYEVKYIPGAELYQARQTRFHRDDLERSGKASDELGQRGPYHLSAISQNMDGFKNLIKLSSNSYTEGFYGKPRVDHDLLDKHGKGLILLSGCLNGEVSQHLLIDDYRGAVEAAYRMQSFVGKDNFYIEVMSHGIPEEETVLKRLISVAREVDAKIIPTIDSHYVHKHEAPLHEISLCLGTGTTLLDEKRFKFYNDQFYLKAYDEMAKLFPAEWLQNTLELNEKIDAPDFELKEFQFPVFNYDGDHYEYLRDLTYKGLKVHYGEITRELEDRVEYELGVIRRMGFVDYMLIVWDIIEWCHNNGIYASARGSAAGAVVSYALGITAVDPIRFKLLFERFLIEGRVAMPDIDVDVDEDRRDEVIEYLRTKYGVNRVAHICNFYEIKPRSAIRDAARVLGKEYAVGDKLANLIPPPVQGFEKTMTEAFNEVSELRELYEQDTECKEVLDAAKGLEGLIRQTGVHAAGILVTPGPLTDYMPIMQRPNKDGSDGPITTQWNGKQVESLGLLKIDILGLKNYTIIDKTLKSVKRRKGIDIDMNNLPLDDRKAYELLCSGDTTTIFQIGASGISNLTYEIQPKQLEDLMAVIALYRPGPLGSHMDRTYLARKNGSKVTYWHPKLEEDFKDTYGLCLAADQTILTLDGPIPICDVTIGQELLGEDGQPGFISKKIYTGIKRVMEVHLSNGRCIRCSEDHLFLTPKGWVKAKDLDGQAVAASFNFSPFYSGESSNIPLAIVLAGMIAEGYLPTKSSYSFYNNDKAIRNAFIDALLFSFLDVKVKEEFLTRCWRVTITKNNNHRTHSLKTLFKDLGLEGKTSHTKFIPNQVYSFDFNTRLAFIGMYISCDGHVQHNAVNIRTVSKQLIEQLHDLLHSIGCFAVITQDADGYYLHIRDFWFYNTFIKPFVIGDKATVEVDAVSELGVYDYSIIRTHFEQSKLTTRQWSKSTGISRSLLNRKQSLIKRSTANKLWLYDKHLYVKASVRYTNNYTEMYDIEVDGSHSFIAGSAIVHNCIYQEQILAVADKLGGYSIPDRDGLRKLVGKKEKEKIKLARGEFVDRCTKHSKISTQLANKIFDEIEFFGAYGFNRGHSAAYAYLGFQTAYLKAHYPADYMAAVISCMDDVEKAGEHVNNAKRLGLEIIGPSINTSERDFTVVDDYTIQYGMKTIQGLGIAALDKILNAERNYINTYDWLRRMHPELLNKSLIEHLLFSGALDELVVEQEEKLIKRADRIEILNAEAKELGSYITEHPLQGVWSFLSQEVSHTISEVTSLQDRTVVMLAGLVISKDIRYSKKDRKMFIFFQLQDLSGVIEVAAFSKAAEAYKDIAVGDIVLMRGPISHERKLIGEEVAKKSKLTLWECRSPQLPEYSLGEPIELKFKTKPSPYILGKILDIIEKNPGDSPVILTYPTDQFRLTYKMVKPTSTKVKDQLEMAVLYDSSDWIHSSSS